MFENKRDGLRAERLPERTVVGPELFDRALQATRQDENLLPDLDDATCDLPAQTAEVMEIAAGGIVGPIDPLHGQSEGAEVPVARDVNGLKMVEQSGSAKPGCIPRRLDDIV